jgi:hypothetical protein
MTFGDLEHCVHENIIAMTNDPAVISAQVTDLLNALDKEDGLVVRRVAKDIAEGIAHERAVKDGDMVSVIGTLSAALNPMIAWLEHHDYNGGSLRQVALAPRLVCPFTIPRNDEKSPGGKFNRGQVRDIVREVAMNPSLGVETAREILDGERDGAKEGLRSKARALGYGLSGMPKLAHSCKCAGRRRQGDRSDLRPARLRT